MISIIVPAYNAGDTIADRIGALQHQSIAQSEYEIIVVDDGSSDDTAQLARQTGVRLMCQTHQGPGAARNLGANVARGELLMFTDADCCPTPDWVEQLRRPFANPDVMGAKGVYRTHQKDWMPRFIQAEFEEKYRRMRRLPRIDFIDTYSAAYRRELFCKFGGFSTEHPYPTIEDMEFSFRLAEQGYNLQFAPDAIVYHRHRASLWRYLVRKMRYGIWRVTVYQKYPRKVMGDSHTAPELKAQFVAIATALAFVPFAVWNSVFWLIVALGLLVLVLTTLPFSVRTWRRDHLIAVLAPPLLCLCAFALMLGLLRGVLDDRLSHWSAVWAERTRAL
jgi:cellulose synthase/poly-beta-1,6-N-acetylglucosamine synthase-like glycosyltransferase